MKLILFLAAIYSLIFHQCHKDTGEMTFQERQKSMAQKVITGNPASSVKLYQQQFIKPGDSIERLGFVSR